MSNRTRLDLLRVVGQMVGQVMSCTKACYKLRLKSMSIVVYRDRCQFPRASRFVAQGKCFNNLDSHGA